MSFEFETAAYRAVRNEKGKGTKRPREKEPNYQNPKKSKWDYYERLLRMVLEFIDADCAKVCMDFVGKHCLPMLHGSEKHGKLPSAVLRGYTLHGFHFSEFEPGAGMFIPNVTVICTKGRFGRGIYYLIVKVTRAQIRGILLKTVCTTVQWPHGPITCRKTFIFEDTFDGAGLVKKLPAGCRWDLAGTIHTPAEERMPTTEVTRYD